MKLSLATCFGPLLKRLAAVLVPAFLGGTSLLLAPASRASVETLTLSNVTFADGTTVTGSVTEDLTTFTILSFNLLSSGSATLPAASFGSAAGDFFLSNQVPGFTTNDFFSEPMPIPNGPLQELELVFSVDPVQGLILSNQSSLTEFFVGSDEPPSAATLTGGELVAAVPEPSSLVMVALAIGGLFGLVKGRKLVRRVAIQS